MTESQVNNSQQKANALSGAAPYPEWKQNPRLKSWPLSLSLSTAAKDCSRCMVKAF